jgi:hypothetical protein
MSDSSLIYFNLKIKKMSKKNIKNIYEGVTPESEISALRQGNTHHLVAMKFISMIDPLNIFGKTLIDVGCGPNPMFSLFALSAGCSKYVAIDRANVLEKIKNFYKRMLESNYFTSKIKFNSTDNLSGEIIKNIECGDNFDNIICHMQMLLMHIQNKNIRKDIIKAILLKGKVNLFTETNWASFDLNYSNGVLKDLKNAFKDLLSALGINRDYHLFEEIYEVIMENKFSITALEIPITISNKEADIECWRELVFLIERGKDILSKSKNPENTDLIGRLENIQERLFQEEPFILRPIFSSVVTTTF